MTIPADYNAVSISMTPAEVYDAGMNLKVAAQDVITALTSINKALDQLQLSWTGASASAAKDFADQWTAAMTNLFGTDKDSSTGVLNQAITTLLSAGGNYGAADQSVEAMFNSLSGALTSGGSGSDTTPIPAGASVTDGSLSSVGETDWTALQ